MINLISPDNICSAKRLNGENILFTNNHIAQRVKSLSFINMMNITTLYFPQTVPNSSKKAIQDDNYEYCLNTMANMIKKYISKFDEEKR